MKINPAKWLRLHYLLCIAVGLLSPGCHTQLPALITPVGHSSRCIPSAHRGDREAGPDNSASAIKSALQKRFPYIEIDVRRTRDGELVLFHDRTLSPDNARVRRELFHRTIGSLTKDELSQLFHTDGSAVLTLQDALSLIRDTDSLLQLDLKPDDRAMIEDVVRALLPSKEVSDKVIIQCQHSSCIADIRALAPHIKVLARVFTREQFDLALRDHPYLIQVDADLMSEELARAAEAAGSLLLVKTLGEPPDTIDSWRALCASGADVILTDRPANFLHQLENDVF